MINSINSNNCMLQQYSEDKMSKIDLLNFQEKFHLSNNFIEIIESLLDKLVDFGYIGLFKKRALIEKLYDNINEVYIGTQNQLDYKTGFYDANKKILYIKNEKDIASVYLRLLYIFTTSSIDDKNHSTGYMITKLRTDSYKLEHINFGINRAIMSNLVCKLCNMVSTNIRIFSTYKTYTHNFLGHTIEAENNIYALEGKILSELCFALNIDEQILFTGLFSSNPYKYLENLLNKKDFPLDDEFFSVFDNISRKYNWYNKLVFLSRKLNSNYLEFKKHALDNDTSNLIAEKNELIKQINYVLNSFHNDDRFNLTDDTNSEGPVESVSELNLNEELAKLEEELTDNLISIQNMLCKKIIANTKYLTDYQYASRLKQFSSMLIIKNEELEKKITDTILYKLLPKDEVTTVTLTLKIKYMLIQNILSESHYSSISKAFTFNVIPDLIDETHGSALTLLNINGSFARLIQIDDLNMPLEKMNTKPSFIPLDNFAYLLNSDYSNMYVGFLEKIYTALRFKFGEFHNLKLTELYMFEYNNKKYLIATLGLKIYVLTVDIFQDNYDFKILDISEKYYLFGKSDIKINNNKNLLPTIYNK